MVPASAVCWRSSRVCVISRWQGGAARLLLSPCAACLKVAGTCLQANPTPSTLLLLLGVPVAFSIGLSSLATLLYEGLPLAVGFQQMISGMNPFSFLAIPFFIFAGEIMMYGGIADKIVDFAKAVAGHVRGGLGMSNVLACTLFGGVSGSPVADVSAMGSVLIPQMKKEGYDADYAVNVTTHASLVGALMPTSHNLIIFTLAASGKVSIAALILAGIVPALLLTICNLVAAYAVAVKRGYPAGTFPGWSVVWYSFCNPCRVCLWWSSSLQAFCRALSLRLSRPRWLCCGPCF